MFKISCWHSLYSAISGVLISGVEQTTHQILNIDVFVQQLVASDVRVHRRAACFQGWHIYDGNVFEDVVEYLRTHIEESTHLAGGMIRSLWDLVIWVDILSAM